MEGEPVENIVRDAIRREFRNLSTDQILKLLGDVGPAACDDRAGHLLEDLLVLALMRKDGALAADYVIGVYDSAPERWAYLTDLHLFEEWAQDDLEGLAEWLEKHRDLWLTGKRPLLVNGGSAAMRKLLQVDTAAALAHAKSLPPELAFKVVDQTFRSRSGLLAPDQAIRFLRQALTGGNHEALVGYVCGGELYSKGEDGIRSFFRVHEATLGEREAIILEAAERELNMGYGGDDRTFVDRVRAFAEEEGPGVKDEATGIILGIMADRNHDDKAAVDQILEFDLRGPAIQAFLKKRGNSFDARQRERIADRTDP